MPEQHTPAQGTTSLAGVAGQEQALTDGGAEVGGGGAPALVQVHHRPVQGLALHIILGVNERVLDLLVVR